MGKTYKARVRLNGYEYTVAQGKSRYWADRAAKSFAKEYRRQGEDATALPPVEVED